MKKHAFFAMCLFVAFVTPLLLPGCKKAVVETPPERRNAFYGLWEGKNSRGETYSMRFTNTDWESHVEQDGTRVPQYKGTYTFSGTRLSLTITHQTDPGTGNWVTQKGNLGPNLVGNQAGNRLRIVALTNADLVRGR
jgi:hypothetical protein